MKILKISYERNKNKPILLAFATIKDYFQMDLLKIKELKQDFDNGNDIILNIEDDKIEIITELLNRDQYQYQIVDSL